MMARWSFFVRVKIILGTIIHVAGCEGTSHRRGGWYKRGRSRCSNIPFTASVVYIGM